MWRASSKLRCACKVHTTSLNRCGFCTKAAPTKPEATAAAAAKGSQPPLTQPPPPPSQKAQAPPPPPPSDGGSGGGGGGAFFKLLGLTLVGSGATVGYAWYDPKFRKQVEDNVPGSKTILDAAFAYLPPTVEAPAAKPVPAITPKPKAVDTSERQGLARTIKVAEPVQDKPTSPAIPKPSKKEDEAKKEAVLKKEAEDKAKKDADKLVLAKKEEEAANTKPKKEDMVQRIIHEKEVEEAAENAALETILSDVLGETVEATRVGIESLNAAATAVRSHVKCLKAAMDEDTEGNVKSEQWRAVSGAHEEKLQAEHKVESVLTDAKEALEKLHQALKDGRASKITRKNKALLGVEESYAQISYDVKNAEANLERAHVQSRLLDDYRDLIKKGREEFRKEMESVRPEVRIGRRVGGRMTEDELNLLIAHAHRRIEQLQHQLAEQQALEGQRLEKAVHKQQLEDLRLADSRVMREINHIKSQFELEKRRMEEQAETSTEQAIRQQLTRQAAAHSDHLSQVLTVQKDALDKKYEQLLHDQVIKERDSIRQEIAGWVSRLKGIETAIEARAEMEKVGRKAQELWLACQTLVSVIDNGEGDFDEEKWERALKPLEAEIAAIRSAGNEHPFVNTVVATMPSEALTRGVWTKEQLIDRFDKVQRVCRRVAMVDETGATLYRYFLSYMQSLLVFEQRPLTDLDQVDPSKLNTFMLVNNARRCLERGDLEQAVRYVNQLSGEPRRVATDWLKEARLLLETKQAADALFAHASSAGLGSLF